MNAIRKTAAGNRFFSPVISERLLAQWGRTLPDAVTGEASTRNLTNRQIDVLQLIAEGYSSKQIAQILSLSVKTIEKHRSTLMARLARHNIAELTRYAMDNGVIESTQIPNMPFPSSGARPLAKPGRRGGPTRRERSPESQPPGPPPAPESSVMQPGVGI